VNNGTKVRTIALAVAYINQVMSTIGVVDLGNDTANLVYKIISLIVTIVAGAFALYYNNDFTVEGMTGTQITREMKRLKMTEPETVEEPEDSEVQDGQE
jgi:SPP1 family holin